MNFPIIENTYQFECSKCGNCCTGDQQVNLNPYDLYKMTRFNGFNHTKQLFDNGLIHLVKSQNNAWIPQIKFKSIAKKKHKFCPFLINELNDQNKLLGLCSLHREKKPLICSMAPVGRVIDFSNNSEKFVFVKPAPDCPGVEIKKENKLNDLKKLLSEELEYEKQFLMMLDLIVIKKFPKEFFLKHLYFFSVEKNIKDTFNKILQKLNYGLI
jgi:Fe-S-cluster containining protein